MFTGIIQKVGKVTQTEKAGQQGGSTLIRVATGYADLESGESIAVNGACLTVTEFDAGGDALFFVSPETLAKTSLGALRAGSRVNLERALTLAARLSGHLVQGHVDGLGRLASVDPLEGSYLVRFEIPAALARYCVEKGSIALNGVSLTINRIGRPGPAAASAEVFVTLIPHTWEHTQFSSMAVGDPVNVEVDVLAKYVESLSMPYGAGAAPNA